MTFLFILCLVFSFVLLGLASYATIDALQLILFISAGLLMFVGGFGLLRLRHKTTALNTSHDSLRETLAAQEREIARLEEQRKTLRFSSAYEEADADRVSASHRSVFTGDRSDLISQGFVPCGQCCP